MISIATLLLLATIAGQVFRPQFLLPNGLTLLDAVVIILDIAGLLLLRFKLSRPPHWFPAITAFLLVALISLAATPLKLTPGEYLVSLSYTLRVLAYALFGWILFSGTFAKLGQKMNTVFTLSGIILTIIGLVQLIFLPDLLFLASQGWDPHYFRTVSTLLDPNFLGIFLSLAMASFITYPPKFIKGKFIPLLFLMMYLALATTFSRSAYVAFLATFITLSLLKKSVRLAIMTVLLCLGLGLSLIIYQSVIAKPRNIDRQQSAQYRLGSWETGLKLVQASPLLGVGFNSYRYALREYQLAPTSAIEGHGGSGNDSSLLFVAATTGILGLAAYLFFLGKLFSAALRNHLLLSGLFGIMASSFTVNSLFYPWVLLWLMSTAAQPGDEVSP